jgi:signal transduction histidine kinase/ligand-binding sensor domain-containing protein/ActR/RegA family two-component response regulator
MKQLELGQTPIRQDQLFAGARLMTRSVTLFFVALLAHAQPRGDSAAPIRPNTDHDWARISGEAPRIRFEALSPLDGVSLDRVFQILQDRRDFTWFTTITGLYRWDGYQHVHYEGMPMSGSFPGHRAIPGVLYEARNGTFWVASDVVTSFDPFTGKFGAPLNPRSIPSRPMKDAVTGFFEDRDGSLWLGVSTYEFPDKRWKEESEPVLYHVNPTTRTSVAHPIDPKITLGRPVSIRAIEQDRYGHLWLGTSIGLIRFDLASGSFQHFPHDHPGPTDLPVSPFNALYWDATGHLWLHVTSGIERFDPVTGLFDRFTEARFQQMRMDSSGRIWLWPGDPGLMVFDPSQSPESALKLVPYRAPGGSAVPIFFSVVDPDRQGNVWAYGLAAGTVRYSPATTNFGRYLPEINNPNSLNGPLVMGFAENSDGTIWVSTAYTGLALFDPRTGSFTQFHHDPKQPEGLQGEGGSSVYVDRSGAVWVGMEPGFLGTFDRKNGRYREFPEPWSEKVYSMFEDSSHRLWASASYGNTRAIDLRTMRLLPQSVSAYVTKEDREGNLWFGTDEGLTKLDRSGHLRSIALEVPESSPLQRPQVFSLHFDDSGILWAGGSRGLFRFDPRSEKATRYAMNEGLPVEEVSCLLPDDDGNLWLSTPRGISRFDVAARHFYNYDERDGLQPRAFARFSCFQASDHRLYFGGSSGFNAFYPRDILARVPDTHVVLTSLEVKKTAMPVVGQDQVTLPYNRNDLSLEFAALNAVNPGNLIYRFRLEPLEKGWIETDSLHRTARYTALAPGNYLFRSQASIDGRTWIQREGAIRITLQPPWWGTWWARAGAILLFAGILFASYKVRVSALEQRQRRLSELVDSRTAELATARNRAEAANAAKSIFLANMSHELRNPLSSILAITSLLRQEGVSAEQHEYLNMIDTSGEHLLAIINDVLDMAKIEAGKQELVPVSFDVVAFARNLTEMMRVKAAEKNLDLSCICTPDVQCFVRADASKLRQVLFNLFGNAFKFTENGGIVLRLTFKPTEQAGRTRLRFEVEDTGRGIAPEDQARIFDPFFQVSRQTAKSGTGLGLAIACQFVHLMGGTITVESELGRGSCFCVEIPVEVAAPEEAPGKDSSSDGWLTLASGLPEFRVLIAEDDPQSMLVMDQMLRRAGFQVRLVERGAEAIKVFEQWRPHFIWLDLQMPEMSGTEAARRIRGLEHGETVKIAAITASAFESDRQEVLAAGMDDFVRKPYRPGEIFDCLARHLPVHFRRPEHPAPESANGG